MKNSLTIAAAVAAMLLGGTVSAQEKPERDTIYINYAPVEMKIQPRHDYTQTLTGKIFMGSVKFDGAFKHCDNNVRTLYTNCEQAVDIIKGMDNITLGLNKIIYLVGWQYNGHDSKYPALFEGNDLIKRPGDKDALESLRWVMEQGKKYHTAVSLHINMFDAFEDSPLFLKYLENDVLARDKAGHLIYGDWGYKVSYAQEWAKGFAQERIDSLCKLLPIADAGTIHIDAFHLKIPHGWVDSLGKKHIKFLEGPISPYLNFTAEDELQAQINIIKYFDSKGIDVTTEGLDWRVDGKEDPFIGYRPMMYHYAKHLYFMYPYNAVCGGDNSTRWGKVFGNNTVTESIFKNDVNNFPKFTKEFCTRSLIALYLNKLDRKYAIEGKNYNAVQFSDGVFTEYDENKHFSMKKDGRVMADGNDLLVPPTWLDGRNLVAFSENGYTGRVWNLTKDFPAGGKVKIYSVDKDGKHFIGTASYSGRKLKLSVEPGQMLLICWK